MHNNLNMIFENKILTVGLIAWFCSQIIKFTLFIIINKKLDWDRLIGDGGMPSSHSATVTSVSVTCGFTMGWDSPVFGLAMILAVIVMHDASGVRLETGKQAKVINDMMEIIHALTAKDLDPKEQLEEFVGHTRVQVFAGFCLGLIIAVIANFCC